MTSVVVGYDGSPGAEAALARGMARTRDGGSLYVVRAWQAPRALRGAAAYEALSAWSLEHAELEMGELPANHPELVGADWHGVVRGGRPSDVLADVAGEVGADEIVVGTRGAGRTAALLGSAAHELLRTAPCPVTVIPERALVSADPAAEGEQATRSGRPQGRLR